MLSGMTYMEHLQDNIRTYSPLEPCTGEELALLEDTAQLMLKYPTVPCTECQYCMPCPYGLDIPAIFAHYNRCVNEGNVPKDRQDPGYREAAGRSSSATTARFPNSGRRAIASAATSACRTAPQSIKDSAAAAAHRPFRRAAQAGYALIPACEAPLNKDECFLRNRGGKKCKTQIIKIYKIVFCTNFRQKRPEKVEFDGSFVTKS